MGEDVGIAVSDKNICSAGVRGEGDTWAVYGEYTMVGWGVRVGVGVGIWVWAGVGSMSVLGLGLRSDGVVELGESAGVVSPACCQFVS